MELNSRMKDFYDIYYLATHYNFDSKVLKKALYSTLQNRERIYDIQTMKNVANLVNDADMLIRWSAFCKKSIEQEFEFKIVVDIIVKFIELPFLSIIDKANDYLSWSSVDIEWRY